MARNAKWPYICGLSTNPVKELTAMVGEYIFGEKINICDEVNEKGYPEYTGKEYNVLNT